MKSHPLDPSNPVLAFDFPASPLRRRSNRLTHRVWRCRSARLSRQDLLQTKTKIVILRPAVGRRSSRADSGQDATSRFFGGVQSFLVATTQGGPAKKPG